MTLEFEEQNERTEFVPSGKQGQEFGTQPIDQLMEEFNFSNNDLVSAFEAQMHHKNIKNARRGRRLTSAMQHKITEAFNKALVERGHDVQFKREQLFNYKG